MSKYSVGDGKRAIVGPDRTKIHLCGSTNDPGPWRGHFPKKTESLRILRILNSVCWWIVSNGSGMFRTSESTIRTIRPIRVGPAWDSDRFPSKSQKFSFISTAHIHQQTRVSIGVSIFVFFKRTRFWWNPRPDRGIWARITYITEEKYSRNHRISSIHHNFAAPTAKES